MSDSMKILFQTLDRKQSDNLSKSFKLGIFAGVYIGIGGILYSLMTNLSGNQTLFKFSGAFLFCVGLILIIFRKAQLFTGNNLMIASVISKRMTIPQMVKNWMSVYLGNFIGSLLIVILFYFLSSQSDSLPNHLASIANKKTSYSFFTAYSKAIYCNVLVCIAVWFAVINKTTLTKLIGIIIPITTFVFLGFEHSIANMFFIPLGLSFTSGSLASNTQLFFGNLIPVTIGNITGGLIVSLTLLLFYKKQIKHLS